LLEWQRVRALPWRQRNREIEAAVRVCLWQCGPPLSTYSLAQRLVAQEEGEDVRQLSRLLSRLAPHLGSLCRHDGAQVERNGRTWRRWQWYPQKNSA
jgi:hypothetical protein